MLLQTKVPMLLDASTCYPWDPCSKMGKLRARVAHVQLASKCHVSPLAMHHTNHVQTTPKPEHVLQPLSPMQSQLSWSAGLAA